MPSGGGIIFCLSGCAGGASLKSAGAGSGSEDDPVISGSGNGDYGGERNMGFSVGGESDGAGYGAGIDQGAGRSAGRIGFNADSADNRAAGGHKELNRGKSGARAGIEFLGYLGIGDGINGFRGSAGSGVAGNQGVFIEMPESGNIVQIIGFDIQLIFAGGISSGRVIEDGGEFGVDVKNI